MIDSSGAAGGGVDVAELAALRDRLAGLEQGVDDATRIDRIRVLEEVKAAAAAAQARETAAFAASQRAAQQAAGVPSERAGRGIAAQIGLARRTSPWAAQRYTGWAAILTGELPATFAALAAGRISEWRALLVARETAWLSRAHRAAVDAELAPHLEGWGDRRVEAETRKAAYRLDPEGYLARIRGAQQDRRVTVRPAPEVMARLSALLPVAQGVACYATLRRDAEAARAAGDPRSRDQLMADLLIERLTGQSTATDTPVEINLILTDRTLLHPDTCPTQPAPEPTPEAAADTAADPGPTVPAPCRGQEPAVLLGYGPIPAATARDLITTPSADTPMWLRRLYTTPHTGHLAAMDSRRRLFTPTQRHFLTLRDQTCTTPWCDAPIRHTDHLIPAEHGGATSISNGRGSCAACNHAKQAPGWTTIPIPRGDSTDPCADPQADPCPDILTTTPTGHTYRSRPPDLPGTGPPRSPTPPSTPAAAPTRPADWRYPYSPAERRLAALLRAA